MSKRPDFRACGEYFWPENHGPRQPGGPDETSPMDREWITTTLAVLRDVLWNGSGNPANFVSEDAQRRENLALSCLLLAHASMADGPSLILLQFAKSIARRLNQMGIFDTPDYTLPDFSADDVADDEGPERG